MSDSNHEPETLAKRIARFIFNVYEKTFDIDAAVAGHPGWIDEATDRDLHTISLHCDWMTSKLAKLKAAVDARR